MCGFTDVRQRLDGSYYCQICRQELGKDFDERVAMFHGSRSPLMRQLHDQCKQDPTPEKPL
jgi:hypothetical protein